MRVWDLFFPSNITQRWTFCYFSQKTIFFCTSCGQGHLCPLFHHYSRHFLNFMCWTLTFCHYEYHLYCWPRMLSKLSHYSELKHILQGNDTSLPLLSGNLLLFVINRNNHKGKQNGERTYYWIPPQGKAWAWTRIFRWKMEITKWQWY